MGCDATKPVFGGFGQSEIQTSLLHYRDQLAPERSNLLKDVFYKPQMFYPIS